MRRNALEILACPRCLGPLTTRAEHPDIEDSVLECARDALRFPLVDGIPHLVRPDRVEAVRRFAREYSEVWRRDGWGSSDPAYLMGLPYRDATGRRTAEWAVKARSLDTLAAYLSRRGAARAIDLGSGMGWLSAHLARRGLEMFAVDALLDDILGLGAARAYTDRGIPLERVWAEFEHLPFQDGTFDAVICNASLHYALGLEWVARQAARVLRPRGTLIVMNSPIHRDPESARRSEAAFRRHLVALGASPDLAAGYHHLVRGELEGVLRSSFYTVEEVPFDPGRLFRWIRRAKGIALRMDLASFPILAAVRESTPT